MVLRMESSIILQIGGKKWQQEHLLECDFKKKKENVGSQLTEAKTQWIHLRLLGILFAGLHQRSLPGLYPIQGEEETPAVEKN